MNPEPRFDPARSDAIRRMLVATVAAEQHSGTTAARGGRSTRRRTGIIAGIVLLTALVGSGTAALALNGHAWFGAGAVPPAPSSTTAAPPSATPTVTPSTPPPTPTPTADPDPAAPVLRVPTTCEQLLPLSEAEETLGQVLVPVALQSSENPVFYTDRRLGGLECSFSGNGAFLDYSQPEFSLHVVPGVTSEQYDSVANGEGWGPGTVPEEGITPGALSRCGTSGTYLCGFIALVGDYGVSLSERTPSTVDLTAEQKEQIRRAFVSVVGRIAALPEAEPLWQPAGATLTGATTCEGLASDEELITRFGATEVNVFKSDDGEYDFSRFHAGSNVGAYWCSWAFDRGTSDVSASVLPGGASYFAESRAADPALVWSAAPDYPGEAYLAQSDETTHLSILTDDGWVQLTVPTGAADALPGFAAAVLSNVGG